jgi:DNA-binding response OmpR family regulator
MVSDDTGPEHAFRLLLVEDNLLIRDMFAHGLRRYFDNRGEKVAIDHAEDGRQALAMLRATKYDLAIVDYYLPVLDGAGVVAKAREEPDLAGLPIVAISIGGAEARAATLAAGADLFVDKPLVLRDLFALLERLARRRPPMGISRKRIVLFDDSPLILEVLGGALADAGYETMLAANLDELERHMGAGPPDIVLLDVQMPEAFGDDVATVLRAVRGVNAPIYLLSSLDEEDLARRVATSEVEGYIPKSIGVPAIIERVRTILAEAS